MFTCLGTHVCGGGDNRCLKLQNGGAVCTIRCEDENDDSCPDGFSCQDAGKSSLGAELGFHCL